MIAPLRRRHRGAAFAIALAAPLLLALGLGARQPGVQMVSLPAVLRDAAPADVVPLDELPGLWGDLPIHTRRLAGDAATLVELTPQAPLRRPDLLVYWLPPAAGVGAFPERSVVLGALRGRHPQRFALPEPGGTLVLHSVAHDETIASAALPPLPAGATR